MTLWFTGRNTLLTVTLLLLPFGFAEAQEVDQLNQVDPEVEFLSVERAYDDMDEIYARDGIDRSIPQVRGIAVGQSQSELQATLGSPAHAYNDGSFEYHLSLPLTGDQRLTCQYHVFFDSDSRVKRAVWRRPQCADLVVGQQQ